MKRFERYVAIGDSTTEGLEDPDGAGGYRGWADRFAEHLATAQGGIDYANLAVRGLRSGQIRAQQLEPALAMRPDLVTVVSGVNDLLRPRFDLGQVAGELEQMIGACRQMGATVLSFTMPDLTPLVPMARLVRGRLVALNQRLRELCTASGALLVDLAEFNAGGDPRLWHGDRLHANALGHQRIAMGLAHAVGLPGFEGWSQPLPPAPARTLSAHALAELTWSRQHLLPWLIRHARGQSSGDGRAAKRPTLRRLEG